MKISETTNYQSMSEKACELLIKCLKTKPDALFCIATGSSPTKAYQLFVEQIKREQLDTSQMKIIKLDEWHGLEKSNPATCEYYVRKHILEPLSITEDRYISFDPLASDPTRECQRITSLLSEHGCIDCCVLGIGKNGHLGLNEPAKALNPFVHQAVLDAKTKTHSMLSDNDQSVTHGLTLGLKSILDSKEVLLLITGADKSEVYANLNNKLISSNQPANYLWLHDNATCIVDSTSI